MFYRIKNKIQDFFLAIKWFLQRGMRGYDDTACWSIDYWFLEHIIKILKQFNRNKMGWQPWLGYKVVDGEFVAIDEEEEITFEQSNEVYELLLKNFEKLYDMLENDYEYYEKLGYEKFVKVRNELHEKTFKVFSDIFYTLWD